MFINKFYSFSSEHRYRVPEILHGAIVTATGGEAAAAVRGPIWNVLDCGVGTGLFGPLFRNLSSSLVGVDISPAMVARARARGSYDEVKNIDTDECQWFI